MSIDVTAETTVQAGRAHVAAFAMDSANDTRWIGGIKQVRPLTAGPLAVGARVERVATFLGKQIRYVNEIDELLPGQRLTMRSIEAPFPMRVTYAFADVGAGTRVTLRVQGGAANFFRLADPLVARAVRRNLQGDLRRLRTLTEERADA